MNGQSIGSYWSNVPLGGRSSIGLFNNQNYIVSYHKYGGGVVYQIRDKNHNILKPEINIGSYGASSVDVLDNGNFVIAWQNANSGSYAIPVEQMINFRYNSNSN